MRLASLWLVLALGAWFRAPSAAQAPPASWAACPASLSGRVHLEGRNDHRAALVSIEGTGLTVSPDAGGAYVVANIPPGRHAVLLRASGFLDLVVEGIALGSGQHFVLPDRILLAGDLNDDEQIDVLDLVIVGSQFGSTMPDPLTADVNADGEVDILDIVLVAKNL